MERGPLRDCLSGEVDLRENIVKVEREFWCLMFRSLFVLCRFSLFLFVSKRAKGFSNFGLEGRSGEEESQPRLAFDFLNFYTP